MRRICPSVAQEVALIGMLAYLSYLCGEVYGLSGIVTLFCCGVVVSHYALHNVSAMSRVTTVSAFQTLSYLSEGAIFIYVGLDALDPVKWTVRCEMVGNPKCQNP
jgi:NhaP-type Na+/H+ or K+/H+ antiporter